MSLLDPWLGVPVQAAFVGGAFLAMGWIVNGWQNRRDAALRRAERTRDVHRAIYAEIGTNLANLWDEAALDGYVAPIIARMQTEGDGFVPFIPVEQNDHLYERIAAEIHILPRQTIDPIVTYYAQVRSIAALATDMRAEAFARLSVDRRLDIYGDYIAMKKQALAFGRYANAMITAYAKGGPRRPTPRRVGSRASVAGLRPGPTRHGDRRVGVLVHHGLHRGDPRPGAWKIGRGGAHGKTEAAPRAVVTIRRPDPLESPAGAGGTCRWHG